MPGGLGGALLCFGALRCLSECQSHAMMNSGAGAVTWALGL